MHSRRAPWAHGVAAVSAAVACLVASTGASAALFEDDEARRAILELRQRVEQQRLAGDRAAEDQRQEIGHLRRSLLELQNQIETLRSEIARLNGQNEQVTRELSEAQRRQRDLAQGVEDRLRKVEPSKVSVDGRDREFPRAARAGARSPARGRGGAFHRQLPDRAEGQRGGAQDARRADQGVSAIGSGGGGKRAAHTPALVPAPGGAAT
jgi:TolA-binding protein